jgi:RNA polymerase sigma-70 factor (ECF subfamily)
MLKVKNGDLDHLGLLFERYKKQLFGFFYNLNHDKDLSEDLVQNTFMRIIKYKHGFKGDGAFKSWMFHIARNVNIDHFKKNKNSNQTERLETWKEESTDDEESQLSRDKEGNLQLLEKAIEELDYEKRELITMSKIKGFKYKEIGEVLSCSEGEVKVKVFRALRELKDTYEQILLRTN